jgi:hypothetical protein
MLRVSLVAIPLIIASGAAFAAQSNGNAALALAALVGEQSPALGSNEKMVLARFLAGETNFVLPAGVHQIVVKADKITCRLGDVSIVEHSCILSFGAARVREPGRAGQELLATLQQNGVEANGAAGTIYYTVAPIECRVDAATVQSNDGGGARCDYTNGP